MSSLAELNEFISDKETFDTLDDYLYFGNLFFEFIENEHVEILPATASFSDDVYGYYTYSEKRSRPFNTKFMYTNATDYESDKETFITYLNTLKNDHESAEIPNPIIINKIIYATQMAYGCTWDLDSTKNSNSNYAKKNVGNMFEKFIRVIFNYMDIPALDKTEPIPIYSDELNNTLDSNSEERKELARFNVQHDVYINMNESEAPQASGSVKTTSKERMAKIFLDKSLYMKYKSADTNHFAVFLHDIQSNFKIQNGVESNRLSQTFVSQKFKIYTLGIGEMDGVYYCDMLPSFTGDDFFSRFIHPIFQLFTTDIWKLIEINRGD